MVQTLAWCHGRPYPSTALTGTIDETGRHWFLATARHWQATCPDLHRRIIDRCLKAARPTGLVLTRRTDRGLRYSLDFALLRRWYYAAGVKESRLTDPAGENPPFVRHDHDLCDVLALSGVAGGAMLGAIIRQIRGGRRCWGSSSGAGEPPGAHLRSSRVHVCSRPLLKGPASPSTRRLSLGTSLATIRRVGPKVPPRALLIGAADAIPSPRHQEYKGSPSGARHPSPPTVERCDPSPSSGNRFHWHPLAAGR